MSEYLEDKSYREVQRARGRLSYWRKRPLVERASPDLFATNLSIDIRIRNKSDIRFGQTVKSPVYKIGMVAKLLNVTPQAVKVWEENGWIPESLRLETEGSPVRGYTFDQVYSIWQLSPLLNFSDKRGSDYYPFFRELKAKWKEMPDGVLPDYGDEYDKSERSDEI